MPFFSLDIFSVFMMCDFRFQIEPGDGAALGLVEGVLVDLNDCLQGHVLRSR